MDSSLFTDWRKARTSAGQCNVYCCVQACQCSMRVYATLWFLGMGSEMTLTESFPSRSDATAHALRQQSAYAGARVIVSGSVGCFTVSTTLQSLAV
jgi:hypothetical protein